MTVNLKKLRTLTLYAVKIVYIGETRAHVKFHLKFQTIVKTANYIWGILFPTPCTYKIHKKIIVSLADNR